MNFDGKNRSRPKRGKVEQDRALSENMLHYFRNFITNGDPNGEGLPNWAESTGENKVMEFGNQAVMQPAPWQELYDILDEMYGIGQNR